MCPPEKQMYAQHSTKIHISACTALPDRCRAGDSPPTRPVPAPPASIDSPASSCHFCACLLIRSGPGPSPPSLPGVWREESGASPPRSLPRSSAPPSPPRPGWCPAVSRPPPRKGRERCPPPGRSSPQPFRAHLPPGYTGRATPRGSTVAPRSGALPGRASTLASSFQLASGQLTHLGGVGLPVGQGAQHELAT